MTALDELIQAADRLCDSLDRITNEELKFYQEVNLELEKINWEALKLRNEIEAIKDGFYVSL
jgi:predicted  nucleic acid-binding Zn-ribbon protein